MQGGLAYLEHVAMFLQQELGLSIQLMVIFQLSNSWVSGEERSKEHIELFGIV